MGRHASLRGRRAVTSTFISHIHLRFAWQAWHLWHWVARLVRICRLWRRGPSRGRRGTYGIPSFCVAGVALMALGGALGPDLSPVTPRLFAWQAWYLVTSTFISRGRRGTNSHPPSFCVAGVALMAYLRFAWQAWHLWHWVARLVRICRPWRRGCLRGRRGTWWHPPSFLVAGVAQTHIHRRFAWQAWHLWHTVWRAWSGFVAWGAAPLCVAGVALGDIHLRFTWQAWHKLTSTVVLRGRRGTHGTVWRAWSGFVAWGAAPLCVAGVALGDIHLRFTWQAWHKLTSTVVLRGRRGTHGTVWRAWSGFVAWGAAPLCVAGVALGDIHLRFTWQAWHKLTSTVVLRGRRGAYGIPSFCVAGVALMALGGALGPDLSPVTPRLFAWQAWYLVTSTFISRGRRGTNSHPPSFCVAGVALMILCGALGPDLSPGAPRLFAWQAWHLATSTFVSRGRRGTSSHPPSFCVAGVALMVLCGALGPDLSPGAPRLFAWQAWHLLTSTFVSRGKRGTNSHPPSFRLAGMVLGDIMWHPPSFCVAGVPLGDMHLPFVTHHLLHTIFDTPSLTHHLSHLFVTHHLSHTVTDYPSHTIFHTPTLSHAIFFHTQLCHTPTLSHTIFHTPTLSHTIFHTPLCHTPPFIHHLSHITLSHTIFHTPSFTHHFVTYHLWHTAFVTHHFVTQHIVTHHLSHITLSHTIFHTPLCQIPSLTHRFVTHHFVTHHLCHTTIFHTPLCHTPSFTHRHRPSFHTIFHTTLCLAPSFTTPSLTQLCHTPSFAKPSFTHHFVTHHLSHTTLSHALFHTQLSHTPSFTHHFVTHTIFLSHTPAFTYNFVTHNFVLLLDPPPPSLSFLPSPSPLQHLVLIIQRSCLVGLSGPLILLGDTQIRMQRHSGHWSLRNRSSSKLEFLRFAPKYMHRAPVLTRSPHLPITSTQ